MEDFDLVVVGAGYYGLGAAKQYRVTHPHHSLAIFDANASVGGVWSNERIYPCLRSNNLLGTYEYPDFSMATERFGAKPLQYIPAEVMHNYFEAYAQEFGIDRHLRLSTKVLSAEHQDDGGWLLEIKNEESELPTRVFAKRLIVATGQDSEPLMPHIRGQEQYNRPLFHSRDFQKYKDTVNTAKSVTVFGGTKSGWDAVYAYATHGAQVDWIIRPTGHGPVWMAPSFVTPFKVWIEKLVNIRLLHWFAPCIWGQDSGYHSIKSFWHGTAVGRAIVSVFWKILASDVIAKMKFDTHPELKKLKPTASAMHTGTAFGIFNYATDFYQPIRDGTVKIYESDLSHLSEGKVHLDDEEGTTIASDAFVAVTGWKPFSPLKFLPEGIDRKIGLPYVPIADDKGNIPDEGLANCTALLDRADQEIQKRFPMLKTPMKFNPNYKPLTETKAFSMPATDESLTPTASHTPLMLYHFMVPGTAEFLRTKDIAFTGYSTNFSNGTCAHIQGLWISAFFDGTLARDPSSAVTASSTTLNDMNEGKNAIQKTMTLDEVHWQTVLHNRFGKWRYPRDSGANIPDFIFEAVPFMDMMMADLGLPVHRKRGLFKEITEPYGPEDYRTINEQHAARLNGS
ncbi:hypothetical protein FPOAC2_13371 [Fusarium poae]|jgi:cation diffusion facilitator CzcD-associated flavoprotein CzcO|uniref:uncharacterized protein n=1 Tax=Fusarium poae TaxID=36050 RepID=UPI001D059881|nr:uncharacterized protein FPOAC1_013762 [Fusarium poae]KAG8664424.1 hypothetical protein FPOAC1_013762 [Fusarium poae]